MTTTTTADCERGLAADYRIRRVDTLVRTLVALAPTKRSGIPMCHGCVWERVVKPAARRWSAGAAGIRPRTPRTPTPEGSSWSPADISKVLDRINSRPEPTTEIERWLRSQEAYDAVTDVWLDLLEKADPANGHGIGRPEASA